MFTLLTRLFRAVPTPLPPRRGDAPTDHDDRPRGCGWFDSSHELASGLVVWEGIIVVDNTPASPS